MGRADIGVEWLASAQRIDCTAQGVYTYQPHTTIVAVRASESCTWTTQAGFTVQFVGQLTGELSPGVLGHALRSSACRSRGGRLRDRAARCV